MSLHRVNCLIYTAELDAHLYQAIMEVLKHCGAGRSVSALACADFTPAGPPSQHCTVLSTQEAAASCSSQVSVLHSCKDGNDNDQAQRWQSHVQANCAVQNADTAAKAVPRNILASSPGEPLGQSRTSLHMTCTPDHVHSLESRASDCSPPSPSAFKSGVGRARAEIFVRQAELAKQMKRLGLPVLQVSSDPPTGSCRCSSDSMQLCVHPQIILRYLHQSMARTAIRM